MRFRLCLAFLLAGLAGCSTAPKWPAPKNTTEVVLDHTHREGLATLVLGDAIHLYLPPPIHPGTHWEVLVVNDRALRQMYAIRPAPSRPGWSEVAFQAIHVVIRTQLKIAALPDKVQNYTPDDLYTFGIAVKHAGE